MELQVRQGELKRAILEMGPAIRRLSTINHPAVQQDVRMIVAQLAKMAIQDQNRRP